ncbi:MAG: HAD family hydrolase [Candidatus Adiutrix sp.]|jgi:HAD superfamily hydrolase (TIGR01549 family)|nr:HAD family hydrolase [Candidatus Adiutrix sp.]
MLQTVIFDFDLTLVDSVYAITRGLNKMAGHFGLPAVTENDTRRVMSLESRDFWMKLWGRYDEAWSAFFVAEVAGDEPNFLEVAPGVEELLGRLKKQGLSLGLATNRDNAWAALAGIGLARFFDTAVGSGDVAHGKPSPDMIFMAMDQMQSDPAQTLYVGDAVFDMLAASRAGVRAVGLLEGGTPHEELLAAGAWRILHGLQDLEEVMAAF